MRLSHPGLPLRSKGVTHLTYYGSLLFKIRKVPYTAYFFPLPVKPQMMYSYLHLHYRYPPDKANPTADELK